MSTLPKIGLVLFLVSALFAGFTIPQPTHAASFTAVQNGSWADPATWGGSAPTSADDVTIPAGLTVNRDTGTTLTNNGTFINNEIFNNNSGSSVINNGHISTGDTFTNNSGATLTNNGTITADTIFSNYGTIINNGSFTSQSETIVNTPTLDNKSGGIITNYGTLISAGFALANNGTIDNYGKIQNNTTLNNNGTIDSHCVGVTTGNPVSGNPVLNPFVAVPPTLANPAHRTHTTDTTPTFSWSSVTGAQSYRLTVYTSDRSFEYKKRTFNTNYTLLAGEALTPGTYLWRIRTQDAACSTWTGWSKRNTLFID